MNDMPEQERLEPELSAAQAKAATTPEEITPPVEQVLPIAQLEPIHFENVPDTSPVLFQSWSAPEAPPPTRIPNFGHLCILALLLVLGWLGAIGLAFSALHFHLFGVNSIQKAATDIHYTLGTMVVLYLLTFGGCLIIFPIVWQKGLFRGLQWNGATAFRLRGRLFGAAGVCFALAMIDQIVLPGPDNAPIDKLFQTRLAAWSLFVFGITFAPFFEEILFRGFLLPALCTACDWTAERFTHSRPHPLDQNGHPQWSMTAMIIASILTSIPFASMHAEQTANALGPFLLLVCVSLVLCAVRLATRSLAASMLVHASYNFVLFSLMLVTTHGFQHLDKM
jgi:membrane protease YdiL (CAAX protease family)